MLFTDYEHEQKIKYSVVRTHYILLVNSHTIITNFKIIHCTTPSSPTYLKNI